MLGATDQIRNAILGRYPLLYLQTWEESRAVQLLQAFSVKLFNNETSVHVWTIVSGLDDNPAIREPQQVLHAILNSQEKGFYVLKDFSHFMSDPAVERALRDAYYLLQGKDRYIAVLSPEMVIPESLKKEMQLIQVGLPDETELTRLMKRVQQSYPQSEISEELFGRVVFALKGLSSNEVTHILHRIYRAKKLDPDEMLGEIFAEKELIVKKTGYLEFIQPNFEIQDIGGLDNLKDWLVKRQSLFTQTALDDGMPVPRGILLMGMSGCGKSLAAKVTSGLWKVPLFRLDMNLVFSGMYGSAELAFHQALQTVEAVAPAVLWIDELENSLGMDEGANGGAGNTHIFSAFLTWMQEKSPLVFVAATANRIQALPAEVIRKGRFDQVFFIDLPNDEERKQIFEIHLRRNGADPSKFDRVFLAAATKGWNGAEIEQAILSARVDAYHDKRPFTIDDITRNTSRMVALSKTMEDQMKKIRSWAYGRATPASKYANVPRM